MLQTFVTKRRAYKIKMDPDEDWNRIEAASGPSRPVVVSKLPAAWPACAQPQPSCVGAAQSPSEIARVWCKS